MWSISFGWLCRRFQSRRQQRPTRRWVKYIRPFLEILEKRQLFNVNVLLPQQLDPIGDSSQSNPAAPQFRPAAATLMPDLGLQSASLQLNASVSLTDNGVYQLTLTRSGPYDANGDRYTFQESGPVSFALTELGTLSPGGFSFNSIILSQTATLSWSLLETNSSGDTVQFKSGDNLFVAQGDGDAPFDPLFPPGFNWLSLTQQVSSLNSLGLGSLSADSLSVQETGGSDSYLLQETNGVATVQGNVRQPLSDSLLESGQDNYNDTAVEQFNSTQQGSDSFSLSELGKYANNSYALNSVAYEESKGQQTSQFNATVSDRQSGSGNESGMQSFSGQNHNLSDSSSDSFDFTSLRTVLYGETASEDFKFSESGDFANDSFSLGSLVYNANGSGGYSLTQTSLGTQTGSFSDGSNASGTDSYGIAGTLTDGGSSNDSGNFTTTSGETLHDNENGNFTLTEEGGYGNAGFALSSFNLSESLAGSFSQQQLDTTTQQGNSTVTNNGTGTDSFLLQFGSTSSSTGNDTSNSSDTQTDSFTLFGTDSATYGGPSSYTLSELGTAGSGSGNVSLSSFVFTSGQSGTWSATGGSNETDIGSSQDSASGSDAGNQTSSNAGVSATLLDSDNFSASDSFSFTSTDSSSSTDSGGFSQSTYQAGVYNHGSYSLSSVVFSSGQSDNWSGTSTDSSTDSGNESSSDGGNGQNNSTAQLGGGTTNGSSGGCFNDSGGDTFLEHGNDTSNDGGFSQFTFVEQGNYGNFSFSFGTVTYQAVGTSTDTVHDSSNDSSTGSGTDSSSDNGNDTSTASYSNSTASGVDSSNDNDNDTFSDQGTTSLGETVVSNDSWNEYMLGAFTGGLWNLSSVGYGDSFSAGFSSQENDSATDSGTDTYFSSDTNINGDTTVFGGGSVAGGDTVNGSDSGTDSFTNHSNDTVLSSGLDSYLLTEQGSFANFSFAFGSYVNQGGDSITETSIESSSGTFSGQQTASSNDNGLGNSIGTHAGSTDSGTASFTNSGSDSFSYSGSDSFNETVVSSQSDSFYESGVQSGGSLSLSLVSLGSGGSDSWSYLGSDTETESGLATQNDNGGGTGQLQIGGGQSQSNGINGNDGDNVKANDTLNGNFSDTSTDSYNGGGSDSWSLTQLGSFSNFSFSFGTYISSSNGSDHETMTETSIDSFTGSSNDSSGGGDNANDSGSNGLSNSDEENDGNFGGSVSFSDTNNSQSVETTSSTDSWSLYESGQFSGNSYSLSSVSSGDSGSDSWSDQGNDTSSDNGADTATSGHTFGNSDGVSSYGGGSVSSSDTLSANGTVSGTDTLTSTDSYSDSGGDTWNNSEQGIYANYSYSFASVVEQGGGSFSGTVQESSTDSFVGSSNQSSSDNSNDSSMDSMGLGDGDANVSSSDNAVVTQSLTQYAFTSTTEFSSGSWSNCQSGSFSGGSFAYASVNYHDGGNDSSTAMDSFSNGGTVNASGSETHSTGAAQCQVSNIGGGGGNDYSAGNANQTATGADTQTSLATTQQNDTWSVEELGSYANNSYALSSYVYSSSSSGNVHAQETDTSSDTVSSGGCFNGDGGRGGGGSVAVQASFYGTYPVYYNDSEPWADNGSRTDTVVSTDTTTVVSAGTFGESLYEAGVFSGDSYSFASVVYNESSTDSSTTQDFAGHTSTDTTSGNATNSFDHSGSSSATPMNDNYADNPGQSFTGQDTTVNNVTQTDTSRGTQALYEAGNFSNNSYSLTSFALSASSLDTCLSSSTDSVSSLQSGSMWEQESIDGDTMCDSTGTFSSQSSSYGTSQETLNASWNVTELGVFGGGSFALSNYSFSAQQSSSDSTSDSGTSSESFSGTNQGDSYSGGSSGSFGDSSTDNSNASVSERGSWSNGSFSLNAVNYGGGGSDSFNAWESSTSSWSGGYSGVESYNAKSSGNDSYSVSADGCYSNGSWSLSDYVLQGGSQGSHHDDAGADASLITSGGCMGSTTLEFSRSDSYTNSNSDSFYQSGMETAGVFSNSDFHYNNTWSLSATGDMSAPDASSNDSWQMTDASGESGAGISGVLSETAAATFHWSDNNGAGVGTSSLQTMPYVRFPGAAVSFLSPESALAPSGGVEGGGLAPVAASVDESQVGLSEDWLSAQSGLDKEAVSPAVELEASEVPANGQSPSGNSGGGFLSGLWDEVSMVGDYVTHHFGEAVQEAGEGMNQGAALMLNQATLGKTFQAEAAAAAAELGETTTAIVRVCGSVAMVSTLAVNAPAYGVASASTVLTGAGIGVGISAARQTAEIYIDGTRDGYDFAAMGTAGQIGALAPVVAKALPPWMVQEVVAFTVVGTAAYGVHEIQQGHTGAGAVDLITAGVGYLAVTASPKAGPKGGVNEQQPSVKMATPEPESGYEPNIEMPAASEPISPEPAQEALPETMEEPAPPAANNPGQLVNCFPPDTLVGMEMGLRPMFRIKGGDRIWGYDFRSGVWQLCEVECRHDANYGGPLVTLYDNAGQVTATAYHPFWVIEGDDLANRPVPRHLGSDEDQGSSLAGRWVNSHDLREGDVIFLKGCGPTTLRRVEQRHGQTPVCNLTVKGLHTFAVGKMQVLVHNMSGTGGMPRTGQELGRGAEGVVYENLDQPDTVVKEFHKGGTSPLQARNEFQNLEKARAIRPDNVVKAQAPADPRQGFLVKEKVIPSNTTPDLAQKAQVLQDFQNIPDAGSNLMWGTTASNPTPRWILIE